MKRFRFRLDGLLRLKLVEEDRCLRRLRELQVVVADAIERRRELTTERDRTIETLRKLEDGSIDVEEVLRHRRHLAAVEIRAQEIDAEVIRRRCELREAQRSAECAVRERQRVERLRDRRSEEHRLAAGREEAHVHDEVAGGLATRREALG